VEGLNCLLLAQGPHLDFADFRSGEEMLAIAGKEQTRVVGAQCRNGA
jgi:hypothetical protein